LSFRQFFGWPARDGATPVAPERDASLSRPRHNIAFTSSRNGNLAIFTMAADGTGLTNLTGG